MRLDQPRHSGADIFFLDEQYVIHDLRDDVERQRPRLDLAG